MQAEDQGQPSTWDGNHAGCGSIDWQPQQHTSAAVCELYVGRERLAEIMDLSLKSIDRLVAHGMPSETWGLRTRKFLPSAAISWAQGRAEVIA